MTHFDYYSEMMYINIPTINVKIILNRLYLKHSKHCNKLHNLILLMIDFFQYIL